MGAPESNAGDDFHIWWAASRALKLIEPGARLRLVALEGLATVDDPDESYETVDVSEYIGGDRITTADAVILSQLKYSTRHPTTAWTAARLCKPRRRRNDDDRQATPRSVIADLAAAYRRILDDHGSDGAAKVRLALVSNQPADQLLVDAVAAATDWVRSRDGEELRRVDLNRALRSEHQHVVDTLAKAVGPRLRSGEFCNFLARLDLSREGTLGRQALARAVRMGAAELTPGHGLDSAHRLFKLVYDEALPGRGQGGLRADDVLAQLGVAQTFDLYPAPPRLADLSRPPLPAPGAWVIADSVQEHRGKLVVAHGPAGAGKTTALRQVGDQLPAGSVVVLFDCYGGGDYLNAGDERHTPDRFIRQVVNELAQRCGTSLLVQAPTREPDQWKRLTRTLKQAVSTLDPDAILLLAVDAADNAVVAAGERGDPSFVSGLLRLSLPERVAVVLTARSHRVPSLGADHAETIELPSFDLITSAAHLRQYRPDATDADATVFHTRTDGNPRAQFYPLTRADAGSVDMATLLERCARTPEQEFANIVDSALQVSGADAGGQRWLALMVALARPVSMESLAVALKVVPAAVKAFAAGLAPGVRIEGDAIQFRDEDFETYVRSSVTPEDVTVAHGRLADVFLVSRATDPDAATNVAHHLSKAGRSGEVVQLVLVEDLPVGIADGFRRQRVQGDRLDLAARAAAETGDAVAAVRVAVRGCDAASRIDTLSRLVKSNLDLVARFTDPELLQEHAVRAEPGEWLGPVWMRVACAFARDDERHPDARNALDKAEGWIRRWTAGGDETDRWDLAADDVARAAEARYRLDGFPAAVDELKRWRPASAALEAAAQLAARVAEDLSPDQVREVLRDERVPAAAQAPILAHLSAAHGAVDSTWVDEVVAALLTAPLDRPQAWQVHLIDAAIRAGNRDRAAALARHWAGEIPTSPWVFARADAEGTTMLRFHAAAAALAGLALPIDDLVPSSLRPEEAERGQPDSRGHDRRQWTTRAEPLLEILLLTVRAATGDAHADEVRALLTRGLADRTQQAGHRWFSHDSSYRAWATLMAEAAVDTGCVADCLPRLVDAAPQLIRDAAPDLWLDLAELLARHRTYADRAADLCARAAGHARTGTHSAADRLEALARAAEIAAPVDASLGRQLFDYAVDAATGINDDAARLLTVHADLAHRALIPQEQRAATATRLIAAAEAVSPHVTESDVIPYAKIAGAAAHLDPMTGLAAVSRWDDQDRIRLGSTLSAALTGAVDSGTVPPWQALGLDHLIDGDSQRLTYQLDIADRMSRHGTVGKIEARAAVARAARWLRRRVPGRGQPELARRLLDTAGADIIDGSQRTDLETVAGFTSAPDTDRMTPTRPRNDNASAAAQALLAQAATRTWATLTDDIAVLHGAGLYGEEVQDFIVIVVRAAPTTQRSDALTAVASLQDTFADTILRALAACVDTWRDWPEVRAWAANALPALLASHLATLLMWNLNADTLVRQLRVLADDSTIRRALLFAVPNTRAELASYGWRNLAVLLGRLCGEDDAAAALLALLDDRALNDTETPVHHPGPAGPLPPLLWSIFGHPRRELRWRAAHATRDLLTGRSPRLVAPLVCEFMRCLDGAHPGPFRDKDLHFYQLSAATGLLVALHRVATDEPALLASHLDDLIRHATSRELPHAQIRELARRAALAVAGPANPAVDGLRHANQPSSCATDRKSYNDDSDRRVSDTLRYDFDGLDTLPYWFGPLARVFDVPVDTVAEIAEGWIIDRWGLGHDDWFTDARELRDQRSWERTSHRQGSIPPEESLRLYLEFHAMMTAAGELADSDRSVRVRTWSFDDGDPWGDWLSNRLPSLDVWVADLAEAVPAQPEFFNDQTVDDDTWDAPASGVYDRALGISSHSLPPLVVIAAGINLSHPKKYETTYIRSALVGTYYADDLLRAFAAASDPRYWKLPDEGETEHEVDFGVFQLHGWLVDPDDRRTDLDGHDPYAHELSKTLPLPGDTFRAATRTTRNATGRALIAPDQTVVVKGEQWADRDPGQAYGRITTSSGYRVHVNREVLLRYLAETEKRLLVEVQIGRRRGDEYPPPRSHIYLIDAQGRVTTRRPGSRAR